MSRWSGKCDVADHFWMRAETDEDVQKEIDKTNFYMWINDRRVKLDIHTVKDLVPYYPFLISMSVWDGEHGTVVLSKESFVDREEREFMEWNLRDAIKEYKKCKRKKIPFDPKAYLEKHTWWTRHNYTEEIVNRVARDGLKANLDGLYSESRDKWMRIPLAQEMKRYGYDDHFIEEWVFGWRKKEDIPNWKEEKTE